MKNILILSLFLVGVASASELSKEIKYLGNNGSEESHEIICVNEQTGIVTINNESQEMTVRTDPSSTGRNIGRATLSEAEVVICK